MASASYYKEPTLRMMGDVDVLIDRCDTEKVNILLQKLGYTTNDDIFKEDVILDISVRLAAHYQFVKCILLLTVYPILWLIFLKDILVIF